MATTLRLPPDPLGSAFQTNWMEQLTGPFTGGSSETSLEVDAGARCAINWTVRYPLVLASLKRDLSAEQLRITPTLAPGSSGSQTLPVATFAPYSEAGATVIIHA